MAAKTPSSVARHSSGSQTKIVATFTDIDNGDTWASGLSTNVADYYMTRTDAKTTYTSAYVINSSGTFTFYTEEDNITGTVVVFGNF
jgi:hypothetical protein